VIEQINEHNAAQSGALGQFGEVFGLSYSAVSRRAEFIELKIQKNKVIKGNTRQLSC
jgi:hypothetical protein